MQLSSCENNRISLIFSNVSALGPQLQISLSLMGAEVKGSPFWVSILEEVDPKNCVVQGDALAVAGDVVLMVNVVAMMMMMVMMTATQAHCRLSRCSSNHHP
jgi:hypothetical protein